MLAQESARILIQRFDIVRHRIARQHAKAFNQLKRESLRKAGKRLIFLQFKQRFELRLNLAVYEMLQPTLHFFGNFRPGNVIHKNFNARFQRVLTRDQFTNRGRSPHQSTLFGEINFGIRRVVKPIRAQVKMRCQSLQSSCFDGFRFLSGSRFIQRESKAFQPPDEFAFYGHITCVVNFGHHGLLLAQSAQ